MTLTQERLKELLEYNPETGLFIRKQNKGKFKKGDEAGYNVAGYVYITIDGNAYPAHRLVFLYMDNFLPSTDVDHKNMIRMDNRRENLRVSTRRLNMLNMKQHIDSASPHKNVYHRKDTNTYSVRLTVDGKYKTFGCFDNLEMAISVAREARRIYHGEYANE